MLADSGGHVHLVESDGRKAAFLRTVIRELARQACVNASKLATLEEAFLADVQVISARFGALAGIIGVNRAIFQFIHNCSAA